LESNARSTLRQLASRLLPRPADPSAAALARANRHYQRLFSANAGKPFDADYLARPRPLTTYIIGFGHRTGSTMLKSLLSNTNVLGSPGEFVNPREVMPHYVEVSGAHDLDEYFAYMRAHRSTPNGVFGMKSIFPDFVPFSEGDVIDHFFERARYIYLTREDMLRQAVSLVMAHATGVWYSPADSHPAAKSRRPEPKPEPVLDEALVLRNIEKLRRDREQWERFFRSRGIQPLRLTYEQLVSNHVDVVLSIAQFLDIDLDPLAIPAESETLPQANETNERWVSVMRERHRL
jgi:trehalose 2-sulfotransferase